MGEIFVLSIILHLKVYKHTDMHTDLKNSTSFVACYPPPLHGGIK